MNHIDFSFQLWRNVICRAATGNQWREIMTTSTIDAKELLRISGKPDNAQAGGEPAQHAQASRLANR